MSSTEYWKGELKEITVEGNSIEDKAKTLCEKENIDISYHDNYVNALNYESDDKFIVNGDKIYEIISKTRCDENDDIYNSTLNEDGTIDFEVKYYNGGVGFTEAIGYALGN